MPDIKELVQEYHNASRDVENYKYMGFLDGHSEDDILLRPEWVAKRKLEKERIATELKEAVEADPAAAAKILLSCIVR